MPNHSQMHTRSTRRAFTLIELLVVISIIALLIGILLPALGAARGTARQAVCASNMRQVTIGINTYLVDNNDYYPAAYLYPDNSWDGTGRFSTKWTYSAQLGSDPPEGYLHWSAFLLNSDGSGQDGFQCPEMENGGHPATNPRDSALLPDGFAPGGGTGVDLQVDQLAYTANEFLIPRNKFNQNAAGQRNNQLVRGAWVTNPGQMILVTEFIDDYDAIADGAGVSKSHRSINPMNSTADAGNPTGWPVNTRYDWQPANDYGLKAYDKILADANTSETSKPINMVGRHHPGGGTGVGQEGNTNFNRADGSGFTTTVLESVKEKDWGERFYSVTGENGILFGQNFGD